MKAIAKRTYVRMSPRKLRLVADLIRGKKMSEVLPQLAFLHQRAADPMLKVAKQAAANARQLGASGDLRISRVLVDQGPIFKRWQPVSRGRAHGIKKYTSHILIEVESISVASSLAQATSEIKSTKTRSKTEKTSDKNSAKSTKSSSVQSSKLKSTAKTENSSTKKKAKSVTMKSTGNSQNKKITNTRGKKS